MQGSIVASGTGLLNTGNLFQNNGTNTFNLPINFGASGLFVNQGTATFNGVLSGTALALNGGTTVLNNNANSLTTINLEAGTLSIGSNSGSGNGLGSAALNLLNGTVQANIVTTTVTNAVTINETAGPFNATSPGIVTLGGTTPITFSNVTVTGTNTVNLSNTGATTFSGTLAGTGTLNLAAGNTTGALILSGNNSASTTAVNLLSSNLVVGAANALTTNTTLSGGMLLASAPLTLNSSPTINGIVTIAGSNSLNLAGTITTTTGAAFIVDNSTTISGTVNGGLELAAGSFGTLTLANGGTINGNIGVVSGTLSVASIAPLGSNTLNLFGGTFLATAPLTFTNPVQLFGTPTLGNTLANAPTFSGPVNLAATNVTLTVASGATITSGITGINNGLTLAGTGILTLQAANTYTGPTAVNGGTLYLSGSGQIATTSGVTVNQGGT